jgi:glycosyltransferase involved in cell wall biosynthesis
VAAPADSAATRPGEAGALRIAFLGGVPPVLGGGGLERQMERTAAALREAGHVVERVETLAADASFDVLHAFRAELWLFELLQNWQRNRVPLVVSSVLGVAPGREERLLRAAAWLPAPMTSARMRRQVYARADALVVLTEHERDLLRRVFAAPGERIAVVPNGVDAVEPRPPAGLPGEPFLALVGHVTGRKGQEDVLRAVGGRFPLVVAGGVLSNREAFERLVADTGATWLGELDDPAEVRGLQAAAAATALLSENEGLPLTVLESLAAGTPAIVSDLPVHRELERAHPGWVRVVGSAAEVPAAFAALTAATLPPPPKIATWGDVAARLEAAYRDVLSRA